MLVCTLNLCILMLFFKYRRKKNVFKEHSLYYAYTDDVMCKRTSINYCRQALFRIRNSMDGKAIYKTRVGLKSFYSISNGKTWLYLFGNSCFFIVKRFWCALLCRNCHQVCLFCWHEQIQNMSLIVQNCPKYLTMRIQLISLKWFQPNLAWIFEYFFTGMRQKTKFLSKKKDTFKMQAVIMNPASYVDLTHILLLKDKL